MREAREGDCAHLQKRRQNTVVLGGQEEIMILRAMKKTPSVRDLAALTRSVVHLWFRSTTKVVV